MEISARDLKPALPASAYLDPAAFALEQEKIFWHEWFCVARESQLPARGDFVQVSVAGESIIIVRASEGLRAFYNVCRHRGSRLTRAVPLPDASAPEALNSGRVEGAFVCPYHAWSYTLDGKLRAAPHVKFDASCPKEGFSLSSVGCETWGGFVFVNLSRESPPALAPQVATAARRLANYPFADLRRGAQIVYDVRANWKVILENYNECYHCGPVHPELCALVPSFRENGGASLDWDDGIPHRAGAWTFSTSGTAPRPPFPGLSEREKTHHKGEVVYPNLLLSVAAEHVAAFTLWPMARDQTRIACDFLFHGTEVAKPDFDGHEVVEFWDRVNREDWGICESVQSGMSSRGYRGGLYAPMEEPSLDIRRYLESRLGDK
jgi:Rieske 2Fe-2S family protein